MIHCFFSLLILISITTNPFVYANGSDSIYVLKTGEAGAKTLEAQHQLLSESSYLQLQKAGLKEGQVVWDIGCGSGTMTEYLARSVGSTGHVFALDTSEAQLDIAKKRLNAVGLQNVTYIKGDITTFSLSTNELGDIVFSRLLLMHLREPKVAISKMRNLLKPTGVLVLQESTMKTAHSSVKNIALESYVQTVVALGKHKGVDFNIGQKLPKLCDEVGFAKIEHYTSQIKLTSDQTKQIILNRLAELQDEFMKARLATLDQIEDWKKDIQLLSSKDQGFFFFPAEQTHILAWKN